MRLVHQMLAGASLFATALPTGARPITAAGRPAQLAIRAAGDRSIRVTLAPLTFDGDFPSSRPSTDRYRRRQARSLINLIFNNIGSSTAASWPPVSTRSGPTRATGSISSGDSSGTGSIARVRCRAGPTSVRGAYGLSIGPFWGSDIGGFYPNAELTGQR